MIIILKPNPAPKQFESLKDWIKKMGLDIHVSEGTSSAILGLVGDKSVVDID
jgi:3-deoxy-7-phosphoheptulonate synthase